MIAGFFHSSIRLRVAVLIVALVALVSPGAAGAQTVPRTVETSGLEFITPTTQKAIDDGLAYLATRQASDGSFGSGQLRKNVAVTSLAGMAFMSSGSTPGRGKYGSHVEKAIEFVLKNTTPTGYIKGPAEMYHGPMYGHGFAALFLAEVYGMTRQPEIREKLTRSVNLIINTQNDEGGWRYRPEPKDADLSVTVCQIMALRAARNCGIFVPKSTVDKCINYVKRCQNPDGGFSYRLGQQRTRSEFPRSAAGLVALYSAGIYEGNEIERGLRYLRRFRPHRNATSSRLHYFYGHYYAVQAMWHAGGDYWRLWYPAIRDELLLSQSRRSHGSWDPNIMQCPEYTTAMSCIVLQMPNNYLPIFQR